MVDVLAVSSWQRDDDGRLPRLVTDPNALRLHIKHLTEGGNDNGTKRDGSCVDSRQLRAYYDGTGQLAAGQGRARQPVESRQRFRQSNGSSRQLVVLSLHERGGRGTTQY